MRFFYSDQFSNFEINESFQSYKWGQVNAETDA